MWLSSAACLSDAPGTVCINLNNWFTEFRLSDLAVCASRFSRPRFADSLLVVRQVAERSERFVMCRIIVFLCNQNDGDRRKELASLLVNLCEHVTERRT